MSKKVISDLLNRVERLENIAHLLLKEIEEMKPELQEFIDVEINKQKPSAYKKAKIERDLQMQVEIKRVIERRRRHMERTVAKNNPGNNKQ